MKVKINIPTEPASKANSRKIVTNRRTGRLMVIKSQKARDYEANASRILRPISPLLEGDLKMTATLYYASRRPDLDESVIMDVLQGVVYKNDRQIKEKHIYHALDRDNPRAEIVIEKMPGLGK